MKKEFKTTVQESVAAFETILFSTKKVGLTVELPPYVLGKVMAIQMANVTK